MAFEVVMPKWGLSMQEGTIIQWIVQEGEPVAMDEPLLEVETEKMVSVVEAPAAGILGRILHPADSTVPVSEVIAVITEPGEEIPEAPTDAAPAPADAASAEPAEAPAAPQTTLPEQAAPPDAPGVVRAMPAARRIARESGLDLTAVTGTGPAGVITVNDVEGHGAPLQSLQRAAFYSEGHELDGLVYTPADLSPGERRAAVVLCVGYTYPKTLVMPDIARALNAAGYVAMAFDYRGFGASGGERWRLMPREQVTDIRAALTYLSSLPQVDPDNIALLGVSLGGSNAIVAGAEDARARAVVAIEPMGDGERWLGSLRRHWEWMEFRDRLQRDRLQRVRSGRSDRVNPHDIVVPDPDSQRFLEAVHRKYPQIKCDLPLETADALLEYVPETHVGNLSPRPLLLIHGEADRQVAVDESRSLFARAGEPRRLDLVAGMDHFDWVMPDSEGFSRVMGSTVRFLEEFLPAQSAA